MAELQLTGLKPNVKYNVAVRALGDNAKSELSEVLTFNTPASIIDTVNKNTTIKLEGGSLYAGTKTGPGVLFNQNGIIGLFSPTACSFYLSSQTGDAFFAGSITAAAGTIGGFRIGSTSLSATNIVLSSTGGFALGSASQFSVSLNGNMVAQNASITGYINATSGSFSGAVSGASVIGGFISGASISGGQLNINGNASISGYINATSGSFTGGIYGASISGGQLNINGNASIGGYISASSGLIGGWTISSTDLSSNNAYINAQYGYIQMGTTAPDIAVMHQSLGFYAGAATADASTPFWVNKSGNLRALNASITGNIVANSGSFTGALNASVGKIGGWSLAASSLYANNILLDTASGIVLGSASQVKLTPGGTASLTNLYASGVIIATSGSFTGGVYGASIAGSNITGNTITGASISGGQLNINGNASITGYINATSGSFSGGLYASVGTVGGWNLAASSLYATNILLDTASGIVLGSSSQVKLTPGGTASLTNLYASGTIIATSGSFTGGIYGASISGGQLNINGNASITGYINATSGSFSAGIYASVGTIGGFNISSSSLSAGTGTNTVGLLPGSYPFFAGNATPALATFRVNNLGAASALSLYASNGFISGEFQVGGTIYASAKYGLGNGVQIDSTGIYGYNGSSYRFFLPTDALTDPYITRFQIIEAQYTGSGSRAIFVIGSPATGQSNITINGDKVTNLNKPAEIKSVVNGTPTSSATGTGFYFDDAGRFRIASDANNYISGSSGNLFVTGTIVAQSGSFTGALNASVGNIGNWTLSQTGLFSGSVGMYVPTSPNTTEIAFFAGSAVANRATAPFRVDYRGNLVASNASITGAIYAQSGSFTGNINSTASIYGAALYGGLFQTSTSASYVKMDGSTNSFTVLNGASGIHIIPANTTNRAYIHYGSSPDPTGGSHPSIRWVGQGAITLYADSSKYLALGGGNGFTMSTGNTAGEIETGTANLNINVTGAGTGDMVIGNNVTIRSNAKTSITSSDTGFYFSSNIGYGGFTRDINGAGASAAALFVGLRDTSMSGTYQSVRFLTNGTFVGSINVNTAGTTPAFAGWSDYRLKSDIQDFNFASDIIKKIKLRSFKLNAVNQYEIGFIAHEIQEASKDLATGIKDEVDENGNPIYQTVMDGRLIPYLAGALKDALLKIEELETRIAALENK